jgi:predicted aldo/keto reductase-like oxidoreductase
MKTQNGGYSDGDLPGFTPHQAALRFVLEKPGVHLAVPGMLSRTMIDENFGALHTTPDLADLLRLDSYRAELQGKACSFCSRCFSQCRFGTGGLDVARIQMYTEGYGDRDLAAEQAKEVAANITRCVTCSGCSVHCSQGIDIRAAARRVSEYLV